MTQKWIGTVVVGDRDVIHGTLMAPAWSSWRKKHKELPMVKVCAPTGVWTRHLPSTSEEVYRLNQAARSSHIILVTSVVQ